MSKSCKLKLGRILFLFFFFFMGHFMFTNLTMPVEALKFKHAAIVQEIEADFGF